MTNSTTLRRTVTAAAAALTALAGALAALGPATGGASSHREAPLIAADPQVDTTDVYAFRSPNAPGTVTLVSTWIPFEEPSGGPNFYAFADEAVYDMRVDNDGDAKADLIYRWDFTDHYRRRGTFLYNNGEVTSLTDPNLNFRQTYDLFQIRIKDNGRRSSTRLANDRIAAPSFVGDASMPDYESLQDDAIGTFAGGSSKVVAGQADDPFFLDLRVFNLLYGGDLTETGDDTLFGFNVNFLALQVPRNVLALGHDVADNPVIGVWATASRPGMRVAKPNGRYRFEGGLRQVSRLGMPLVNEVVIPLRDKDRWNVSRPQDDGQFLDYVVDPELPGLIESVYPALPDPPPPPRDDLVEIFLTGLCEDCGPIDVDLNSHLLNADVDPDAFAPSEQIRLNMTTPVCEDGSCLDYSRLGVIDGDLAGYPNGRRLADDVIDISLTVVQGTDLGDGVDENEIPFESDFPYIALPHSGSLENPHTP